MTKEQRRAAMPIVTKWIDEMREAFGPEEIVAIRASENGEEIYWTRKPVNEGK